MVGIWWRELLGNCLFHTSETLTHYLDRIEAEIEVIFKVLHLFLLVLSLGWQHSYSVILVFVLLIQCFASFHY